MKIKKRSITLPTTQLYVEEYGNCERPRVILLHGGPGLPGYMRSLGTKISKDAFVVEYYQRGALKSPSKGTCLIADHVRDLDALVQRQSTGQRPILIGSSWGAVLALCYAAARPGRIAKAIVIGTGPLDAMCAKKFSAAIHARLPFDAFLRAQGLEREFMSGRGSPAQRSTKYLRWCDTIFSVYNRDPRSFDKLRIEKPNVVTALETDADYERRLKSGRLLRDLARITDPVFAFHGDYDPIPWEGILPVLSKRIRKCRTRLLRGAGHVPWIERRPGDFLTGLRREILS